MLKSLLMPGTSQITNFFKEFLYTGFATLVVQPIPTSQLMLKIEFKNVVFPAEIGPITAQCLSPFPIDGIQEVRSIELKLPKYSSKRSCYALAKFYLSILYLYYFSLICLCRVSSIYLYTLFLFSYNLAFSSFCFLIFS